MSDSGGVPTGFPQGEVSDSFNQPEGISCPYPGLRSFKQSETKIFFGREDIEDDLVDKLEGNRFLAVIGPSGCGKSSVVRAGLLGRLKQGDLGIPGNKWMVAEMLPERAPIAELAKSLLRLEPVGAHFGDNEPALEQVNAILRDSNKGILNVLECVPGVDDCFLLLLVDQFEELFTQELLDPTDAYDFLTLILDAVEKSPRIYVVLTMRSDYLGQCSVFPGLAEALNAGQFLIPRMSRKQCEQAIVKSARRMGATVEPELVNRLLNDSWREIDQLPVLQHVLMRLWIRAGGPAPDSGEVAKTGIHLTRELLEGDEQIGSLDKALNDHAQRLYDELRDLPIGQSGKPPQEIAKVAFKGLTGAGRKSQDTRRYATVEELSLIAGASVNETIAVLNRFRSAGNQFLRPIDGDLSKDSKVNIVHEAVIRKWSLLTQWVREEARDAEQNRRLSVSARDHAIGEAGLYRETDLKWADERWKWKEPQFRAWARRYQISGEEGDRQAELNRLFEIEMDRNFQFLTDSEAAVKLDQQQERLRIQSEAYAKAAQRSEELERDIQAEQEKAAELEAKLKSEQVSASQMEEGLKLERQRANEFSRKTRNRTRLAFAFGFAVLLMGVGLGIVNHNDGEFALNQRLEIDAQRRKLTAQEQEAAEKLSAADQKTAAALKTLGSTRTADGLLEAKMQRRLDLAQAEEADVKRRLQAEIDLWDRNRTTIATLGHDKFVALSTVSKHLNTIKQLKDASSTTLSYVDGLETQLEQDDIAFNDDKKKLDDAGSNNKVLLGKVGDLQKLLDDAVKTGQKLGDTAVALGHEKDYLSVMLQRFCEAYSATIAKSESKLSPSAHYDLAVSGPKDLIAPTVHYDSNSKSVVASNDEGLGPFQQFDDVTLTDRILSRTYPLAKGYGIRAVAYHPKDQFVGYGLTAGANQPHPQHYVVIYRLPLLPTGSGKTIPSSQSALPPNGSTSVNGGRAVTPNLVDDPTISFLVDSPCVKLVFAKDCSAVIVLTQSGLVSVWHWESGYPLQEKYVRPIGRTSPILSVGFKDDKARSAFVISADGKPEIWKLPVWRPSPPSKPSWKQLKDDLRNLG